MAESPVTVLTADGLSSIHFHFCASWIEEFVLLEYDVTSPAKRFPTFRRKCVGNPSPSDVTSYSSRTDSGPLCTAVKPSKLATCIALGHEFFEKMPPPPKKKSEDIRSGDSGGHSPLHKQPHHRTNHNDVFYLIILITITLASSNNTLPDDGD